MNKSYMYNYIDILNESLGDGYSYYITDNLPIFNIDGLIESYQYDIGNILTESKGDKGKNLIERIRQIGKKILSFLSGILEKIMGFFKKLRNFIRGKIEQLKNKEKGNKNGDGEIIDSKEYSRRKRDEKNKNDNDDDVDEEKLNVVKSKEDIEEERRQEEEKKRQAEEKKRQEEEKKRQEEEKKRQEEEKKKRKEEENRKKREELDKEIERYNSVEVYGDMDFKGGIDATNKLLDAYQDGFRDYVMEVEKFNNVDSILYSMGIELNNSGVKRTTDVKDRDRLGKVLEKFRALTGMTDAQVYTNGKFNISDRIKEERDKIKQIFYGSGKKIKILDFKGTVDDAPYKQLKIIDDRIAKIEASTKNVCEKAIANSKAFMNQLEDVAKRIEQTGEENLSLSNLISTFANAYVQVINKLSSALRTQSFELRSIALTATNAASDMSDIKMVLDDIDIAKGMRRLYESYNDYDGMNWLRDILFE